MARILVIDDEKAIGDLVSRVLSRKGHVVTTAVSGEEGLSLFSRQTFDLLLVDKNLGGMHGGEVISKIRLLRPGFPSILMTAAPEPFALPPERLDGYLTKPFKSLKAVEEVVNQALESVAVVAQRR